MEKATLEFLKNLKLVVNKVHMRYEDDSLSGAIENPYSFGIVIHVSTMNCCSVLTVLKLSVLIWFIEFYMGEW